ncbi:ABC transporter permease subunit, partial [Xanthomonas citri pv. citri]|nr:ABC transporter permease subunit [Xanthomonas citri pv. citri]
DLNWFAQGSTALFVIMLSEIWKTTPFISLLLLAGLAQVPGDLTEAASVDGASWWQRMKLVILPNMKASIMVAVLFR